MERKLDELDAKLDSLWQNGLVRLSAALAAVSERVGKLETRCDAFHPPGSMARSSKAPTAKERRELPRWAYLVIGGALMAGGDGLKWLFAAVAKALGAG